MVQFQRTSTALVAMATSVSPLTMACGEPDPDKPPPLGDFELTSAEPVLLPGCEHIAHELCDVMQPDCQQRVFSLMACVRNDMAMVGQIPPIARLTVPEAIERLGADEAVQEASVEKQLLLQVRGLEMLGLVERGQITDGQQVAQSQLDGVLAYYSPIDREVVLIDRGEPLDDLESNSVLAHELVHVLQDVEHDLYEFGLSYFRSNDSEIAAVSLVEGEATWYEILMNAAYSGVGPDEIDFELLYGAMIQSAQVSTYSSGSALLSSRSIFPYTYGTRYAAEIWREGGSAALDSRYGAPPTSTLEVVSYLDEPVDNIRALNAMPAPIEDYQFVADDVAGSWVVGSMLRALPAAEHLGDGTTDKLTGDRWRGDRFWFYARPEGDAVAALWLINWDDELSAKAYVRSFPQIVEPEVAYAVWSQGTTARVVALNAVAALDEPAWVQALSALSLD